MNSDTDPSKKLSDSPKKDTDLEQVIQYMQSHWASPVKPEWQVSLEAYPEILDQAVRDLSQNATKTHRFFRIAGISGSGKTTQILPAVEAYCEKTSIRPILLAARRFLDYHPYKSEILKFYGKENLRKMTDEFVTIMLFMAIAKLTAAGFDIILDVTLLDPKMEAILLKFLKNSTYNLTILMVAVSPVVTEHFLADRSWRHTRETEQEFIRATELALNFYAKQAPNTRIILWSVYDQLPVYDGPISNCLEIFQTYTEKSDLPKKDDDLRRQAKIDYLLNK